MSSAKLRKDLSHLGSYGTRGVGYDVRFLAYQISRELGLTQPGGVVIVGAGNLGHALVAYRGFASRGFAVVGLLDSHPDVVGQRLGITGAQTVVRPMTEPYIAFMPANTPAAATRPTTNHPIVRTGP